MGNTMERSCFMMERRMLVRLAATISLSLGSSALLPTKPMAQAGVSDPQIALPDGEVSKAGPFTAWLIDPTTRYNHGVLGDAIEAGGFVVERGKKRLVYRLAPDAVFADRRVRLADLNGDGVPEAIIVKAHLQRGAAIAVYRIGADRIDPLAESEAIGTRNRWLNPIGVADFAGIGKPMIAAIITPHLAGSLRLYSLSGSTLNEVTRIDGYTNHIIGKRDLDLARVVRLPPHGPPLVLAPTLDRRTLTAISFQNGVARVVRKWPLEARIESLRIDARLIAAASTASGDKMVDLTT
jgi:hypothetical protein